jgi:hypothetical protein
VQKLSNFVNDVFNPDTMAEWTQTFQNFQTQVEQIETTTVTLIDNTFREKLNSSVGAFDLLDHFKNIKTRNAIQETLNNKYESVLTRY